MLKGSNDGATCGRRSTSAAGRAFQWRAQTRPFKLAQPGRYEHYRIRFTGGTAPISLAEIELLNAGRPPPRRCVIDVRRGLRLGR